MIRKRRGSELKRGKIETRPYRSVCWISAEGQTERDYFSMDVFGNAGMAVRFPRDIHPDRRNPIQVLKRFQKALKDHGFRHGDEAWLVVDRDEWPEGEFRVLEEWARSDERHHLAVSNPKFELFLLMHFEKGNGCTAPARVDAALKRHMPRYAKRIRRSQFGRAEVEQAIRHAHDKRSACGSLFPAPGVTDAHLLAERLLG